MCPFKGIPSLMPSRRNCACTEIAIMFRLLVDSDHEQLLYKVKRFE